MTFKKIYVKEKKENTTTSYIISLEPLDEDFKTYFTDDKGFLMSESLLHKNITFAQLPKPLLKQIK